MFETELQYFIANQPHLLELYSGKVLVIKGTEVVGAYDNILRAYLDSQKTYALGTVMIQPCEPGPQAYTVTITSHDLFVGA